MKKEEKKKEYNKPTTTFSQVYNPFSYILAPIS